jgi:RNA polymerase sigma-70 factor (ECF subfamily)
VASSSAAFVRSPVLVRLSLMVTSDILAPPVVERFDAQVATGTPTEMGTEWIDRFHAGERPVLEEVYREHFDTVDGAVGTVLAGADRETAIHEVFFRLLNNEGLRRGFRGGDLGAWLAVVSRHHAIDYARRRNRETPGGLAVPEASDAGGFARSAEARLLIDGFCREVLPAPWRRVFEVRFLGSLSQTEAAAALGMRRTTLAYQELRITQLLRKFLLEEA